MSPILNRPFWLLGNETDFPPLARDLDVDVAVVGAGITGLTAAYMLKREGKTVALIESDRICHGATGYTTAKLTVGHNLIYADLIESFGEKTARLYARSNQEAIERIAAIVEAEEIQCDFERASNYVYVETAAAAAEVTREVDAARAAGVDASFTTETDLPYPVAAAVRIDGQAQFHPWKYLARLARLVDGDGSHVYERTRALGVDSGSPCVVATTSGRVRARRVIIATQIPFLDRGLFFTKAHPMKSYAVGAAVDADSAPRGMYISADEPTRSIRSTALGEGRRLLIVGGEGHRPGVDRSAGSYRRLEQFLRERFQVEAAEYRWSTHDYVPLDRLPYIGRIRRGDSRLLTATGFAKWGLTKGTLAASILTDAVLGRENEFAGLYEANRLDLRRSAGRFAKENAHVAAFFFRDRLRPRDGKDVISGLARGDGTIVRIGGAQYAVSRDDSGELHALSARCTHLGCIVGWNASDRGWECPCHGSRFAADGTLVQGPATSDLPRRTLPRVAADSR